MKIQGICVSVDYADLLQRSIDRWHIGLDRLIVVTSPKDIDTQRLCNHYNVQTHITDIFYANGAAFNKFAALSEAVDRFSYRSSIGWRLVFDADIVPPPDWRDQLEKAELKEGNLYGAYRHMLAENVEPLEVGDAKRMPQSWVLGFFMLFHTRDRHLPSNPLFDVAFPHAGCSDTLFARRWPYENQWLFDLGLIHLGEERQNWMGRHRRDEMRELLQRRASHEDWEHERMVNPPELK